MSSYLPPTDEFKRKQANALKLLAQQVKRSQTYLKKVEQTLQECLSWEKIHHTALLLQANMHQLKRGMDHVFLPDWEQNNQEVKITLDPKVTPYKQIEKLFLKSKKLKKGIPFWQQIFEKTNQQISTLEQAIKDVEKMEVLEQLESARLPLPKAQSKTVKTKAAPLPYKEYISSAGIPIWVGKSARGNDQLTFQYANGSDWWLHVNHYSGSHVIIRTAKGSEPDQKTLEEAMQLAVKHSKARNLGEAEVCITQCKFVRSAGKNHPGKVYISHHRNVFVRL